MIYLYRTFAFLMYYLTLPYTGLAAMFGSAKWKQRLGFYPRNSAAGRTIWLHAASVGEVKVADTLRTAVLEIDPALTVIITVMTDAGHKTAQEQTPEDVVAGFMPLDCRSSIRRFMERAHPDAAVFIETEIWPNMINHLAGKDIPVFLANGRLSEKSHHSYLRVKKSLARILTRYQKIMVQSEADRQRYIEIGADPGQIEIFGSLKFDAPVRRYTENERRAIIDKVPFTTAHTLLTAGSTRPGEEEMLLRCFKTLKAKYPQLGLVLAPRHLNRLEEVKELVRTTGFKYCMFTENNSDPGIDIMIVDVMGMLNDLYSVSNIAFVGGTLVDLGGHNILEPVWVGTPVIYGPSIFNIAESSEYILRKKFGCMVNNSEELCIRLDEFLSGSLKFGRKRAQTDEDSAARRTAAIILGAMKG